MYLLTKDYKTDYQDKSLLLLSLVVVSLIFITAIQSSKYITISTPIPYKVDEKIISIVITPAPVVKKEPKPEVKKVVKKEIKKVVKTKVIEKVVKKKIVEKKAIKQKVVQKTEIVKEVVKKVEVVKTPAVTQPIKVQETPVVPVFDAQMKTSFIAGLYSMLDERKTYPRMAKRRKLEGVSEISFTLEKDGSIKNVFLSKSSGHKILDKAALKILNSMEFYKAIPDAVSLASLNLNIPIKYSRN
nr:energy transducer TonB [uncultured Sulfurimonas sp.]